jgi:hypothetical protein
MDELQKLLSEGRATLASEIKRIVEHKLAEDERREAERAQYFAVLESSLKALFPEALWPYLDWSKIEMRDGYLDSNPWAVFLSVPNCAPIRLSVWMYKVSGYYKAQEEKDQVGQWTKGGLTDGNPLIVPMVAEEGCYVSYEYNRNGIELPLSRLAYALALAECRAQELKVITEIVERKSAEYEAQEEAELSRTLMRQVEPEPTAEERLKVAVMDFLGELVDAKLERMS